MAREDFSFIYDVVAQIPFGRVSTYGQIAVLAGLPGRARLVGRAVSQAPSARSLPCHRVVNAQGRCAPGWEEQRTLLEQEGVFFRPNGCVDLRRSRWQPFAGQPFAE